MVHLDNIIPLDRISSVLFKRFFLHRIMLKPNILSQFNGGVEFIPATIRTMSALSPGG